SIFRAYLRCVLRGFRYTRLRKQQPRAGPHDFAVRPILLPKEDFTLARITVIPSRHQPQMFAEIVLAWRHLRRLFEVVAENLFGRAGLPGNFREAYEAGFREPATANGVRGNRLIFRSALQDHRIQILDAARQIGLASQHITNLFDALVDRGGTLEIEIFAGALALLLD